MLPLLMLGAPLFFILHNMEVREEKSGKKIVVGVFVVLQYINYPCRFCTCTVVTAFVIIHFSYIWVALVENVCFLTRATQMTKKMRLMMPRFSFLFLFLCYRRRRRVLAVDEDDDYLSFFLNNIIAISVISLLIYFSFVFVLRIGTTGSLHE